MASPVVLTKSATRIESFSVIAWPRREYAKNPAIATITNTAATAAYIFVLRLLATGAVIVAELAAAAIAGCDPELWAAAAVATPEPLAVATAIPPEAGTATGDALSAPSPLGEAAVAAGRGAVGVLPESISRFRRFKSARMLAALW